MIKTKILTLFLSLTTLFSFAQTPQWQVYSNNDHILDVEVRGNKIWTVGSGGVLERDASGAVITEYNMNEMRPDIFNRIEIDKFGNIWTTSNAWGLFKFDGNTWTNYTTSNSAIGNNVLYGIDSDSSGAIWIGTGTNGIIRFKDSVFTNFPMSTFGVLGVVADGAEVWASAGQDLYRYDGQFWTSYDYSMTGFNMGSMWDMKRDTSGLRWFASSYGLLSFDDTTWTHYDALNTDLPNNAARSLYIDNNNVKWVGTADSGLYKFDGLTCIRYDIGNSPIPHNTVSTMYGDSLGNLWIGQAKGLTKFDRLSTWNTYTTIYTSDGPASNDVYDIVLDNYGNKWLATARGISKFNDTTWTTYDSTNTILARNPIYTAAKDTAGHLWFGTYNGLLEYDGNNWISHASGPLNTIISDIFIDANNNKWLAVPYGPNIGVIKYDGTTSVHYNYSNTPLNGSVQTVSMDLLGNLWVGTFGNGVYKFDGVSWSRPTTPNSPGTANYVTCSAMDQQGHLWFGTYTAGLYIYDGLSWQHFTTSNSGLTYNNVEGVHFDSQGNAYISGGGVKKYDGSTWEVMKAFDRWEFGAKAMAFDDDGNMYFGSNGLLTYHSDSLEAKRAIKGYVYHDANTNGVKDGAEDYVGGIRLKQTPGNIYAYTNTFGEYTFFNDTLLSCTIDIEQQGYWNVLPSSVTITVGANDTMLADMGITRIDTAIYIGSFTNVGSRCSTPSQFWFYYNNAGSITDSTSVVVDLDTAISIMSSIPLYDSIVGNKLYYHHDSLSPSTPQLIFLTAMMPDFSHMGDTLRSTATIISHKEATSTIIAHDRILTCSYDPNMKEVSPAGYTPAHYTLKSETLHYTIHFQNTGNDTAYKVDVRDVLSSYLDLSTFQVTGSSHPYALEFYAPSEYTFHFYNIMLADSNTNEPLSHGFVSFDIKCLPGIPEGTIVNNLAYIYFDSNPAILTNTTTSNMVSSFPAVGLNDNISLIHASEKIVPHPISSRSMLYFKNEKKQTVKLKVFDIMGKEIYSDETNNSSFILNKDRIGSSGMYFYKLSCSDGLVSSGKLLVE